MKKNAIATAILLATSGVAHSAAITSITISDVWDAGQNNVFNVIGGVSGTDTSAGRFGFNLFTTSRFTGDTGVDMAWGGVNQEAGVFTTGFLFSGATFEPNTSAAYPSPNNLGASGDITAGVLTVSNLDFGGLFGGTTPFYLAPDAGTLKTNFINDIGGGDYEIAFSWSHYITPAEDPSYTYVGFTANWVIEGVAHTVPVPAAAWLMGSGLIGLVGVARRRKSKVA